MAIVFSISSIRTFRVTASVSADALAYLSFLRVALNYWVSDDMACFTFEALVCHVAVDTPRDSSPFGYIYPPVIEVLSPRIEMLSPVGSSERYTPTNR